MTIPWTPFEVRKPSYDEAPKHECGLVGIECLRSDGTKATFWCSKDHLEMLDSDGVFKHYTHWAYVNLPDDSPKLSGPKMDSWKYRVNLPEEK